MKKEDKKKKSGKNLSSPSPSRGLGTNEVAKAEGWLGRGESSSVLQNETKARAELPLSRPLPQGEGGRKANLTLGPLFYNWPAETKRDFYFRIADEACVDTVYLGEVVCFKREPFFEPYLDVVTDRLKKAGKEVVFSSYAVITREREMAMVKARAAQGELVEANDVAAIRFLDGKKFVVGPFVNVFHEGTRDYLINKGASRIVLPVELSGTAMAVLAGGKSLSSPFLRGLGTNEVTKARKGEGELCEFEAQVFGRQPLAVAMRCYHARAYGKGKDGCQFACAHDPDGLPTKTLDGQDILTINGTQVLSHGYVVLLDEMRALAKAGLTHFRLAPQDGVDMVQVVKLYRDVLDGKTEGEKAKKLLRGMVKDVPFINGFYYGREGMLS